MSIYSKLFEIQQNLKAPKGQYNKFGSFHYRSCEDILEAVKPILAQQKTVVILQDELVLQGQRYYIKATACLLDIETGEQIKSEAYAREEEAKKAEQTQNEELQNLFRGILNNENLKVKAEPLKAEQVSGMIVLTEESRRMLEMKEAYGENEQMKMLFATAKPDETLILNSNHKLVKQICKWKEDANKKEDLDYMIDTIIKYSKGAKLKELGEFVQEDDEPIPSNKNIIITAN